MITAPRELAGYVTLNIKLTDAFDNVGPLVDAHVDDHRAGLDPVPADVLRATDAAGDADPVLALLLEADGPNDVLSGEQPEVASVMGARAEVKRELEEARRVGPVGRDQCGQDDHDGQEVRGDQADTPGPGEGPHAEPETT